MDGKEPGAYPVPLSPADVPPVIGAELAKECPDGQVLRPFVMDLFEKQSAHRIRDEDPPSEEARTAFNKWWFNAVVEGQTGLDFRKYPRLQPVLFSDFSNKVSSVAQRHCFTCNGLHPIDDHFPSYVFPIRLAAASRQVMDSDRFIAFQDAMKCALDGKQLDYPKDQALCVAFTYVIDSRRRDPDLDNLTKAAMDAMWRAFDRNDKHVRHMDVAKICAPGAEEFMIVRISKSFLNDVTDVIVRSFNHSWAGQPSLDIEQFLRPRGVSCDDQMDT